MLPFRMLRLTGGWLIPTAVAYALILTGDQREAARGHDAGQPWPATQDDLVAGHPLPRILRGKRFHIEQSDERVEITIPVDFDKAFIYNSRHGSWRLSI